MEFVRGPRTLLENNYNKYGEIFTVPLLHKRMTFLIGPYASAHFFRAKDEELSQVIIERSRSTPFERAHS